MVLWALTCSRLPAAQVRQVRAEGWSGLYLMSPAGHQHVGATDRSPLLSRRYSAEFALHKTQRGLVVVESPFQLGILDRGENFPKQRSRSKTQGD